MPNRGMPNRGAPRSQSVSNGDSMETLEEAIERAGMRADTAERLRRLNRAVRLAKTILLENRVQNFTSADVVELAAIILDNGGSGD